MHIDIAPVSRASPTAKADSRSKDEVLESLRAEIGSLERRTAGSSVAAGVPSGDMWTFGSPQLDALIGPCGLEIGAVHEVKPSALSADGKTSAGWAASCAASRRFALALVARRLAGVGGARRGAPVLVCSPASYAAELGALYGPGLADLGIDPGRLIVAEPARPADVLWAVEQGLASNGLALVVGELPDVELTPARRLALAAARSVTPCVLLTHPRAGLVAATATRWRVAPASGASDAFDPEAPGAARLRVVLERCRAGPARGSWSAPLLLEWCDAAYRFHLAASVADRSARTVVAAGRPDAAVGAGGRA